MSVCSVSLPERVVFLPNGCGIDITHMFDEFGDETDDPRKAYSVVAGPLANGHWLTSEVTEEERVVVMRLN